MFSGLLGRMRAVRGHQQPWWPHQGQRSHRFRSFPWEARDSSTTSGTPPPGPDLLESLSSFRFWVEFPPKPTPRMIIQRQIWLVFVSSFHMHWVPIEFLLSCRSREIPEWIKLSLCPGSDKEIMSSTWHTPLPGREENMGAVGMLPPVLPVHGLEVWIKTGQTGDRGRKKNQA